MLSCAAAAQRKPEDTPRYGLRFALTIDANEPQAEAEIVLRQSEPLLLRARFNAPASRYRDFAGDGDLERDGDYVTWQPPATGGRLRYRTIIDHRRESGKYDARVTRDWALFRGDDIFPPARIVQADYTSSDSELQLVLPSGWSALTPFSGDLDSVFRVDNPQRKFDRPTGWILTGRLGIRRDTIAGIRVAVGAPLNQGAQRLSMLALLRWTMPRLVRELEAPPDRLTIVSAGKSMWRGGLSAPNSVYIHASRPILSENGTSTLLHEVIHSLLPIPAAEDHDWIDEGIAEYLCLRILLDTDTISQRRFDRAIAEFGRRGKAVKQMRTTYAAGNITAKAVAVFAELDAELRKATDDKADLFMLAARLRADGQPTDLDRLQRVAVELAETDAISALKPQKLPGYR